MNFVCNNNNYDLVWCTQQDTKSTHFIACQKFYRFQLWTQNEIYFADLNVRLMHG